MKHTFIITCFGNRAVQFASLVKNLKSFGKQIKIVLVTDNPDGYKEIAEAYAGVDTIIHCKPITNTFDSNHARYGVRNSNFFKAYIAYYWRETFDEDYPEAICLLDDDMKIVSEEFFDGFELAKRFGCCVPVNPRVHVKNNAIGEDTTVQDRMGIMQFGMMPAINISPMFLSFYDNGYGNGSRAKKLIREYMTILKDEKETNRGTLAFSKAMVESGVIPIILSEAWCVCRQNAEHLKNYHFMYREQRYDIEPICLHIGQPEVREVFK